MTTSFYFDWDNIEKNCDNWLYIFDRLPDKMRLIVDFRLGGMKPEGIAKMLKLSTSYVSKVLSRAADRFLEANSTPYQEEWGEENEE